MARFLRDPAPTTATVLAPTDAGAGQPDPAAKTEAAASDKAASSAEKRYTLASLVLVLVGLFLGWLLQQNYHKDLGNLPELAAGVSPFALLYIFAQSIERLLEFVSPLLGGLLGVAGGSSKTKGELIKDRNTKWATAVNSNGEAEAEAAAEAQSEVNQFRANSAVMSFGLATLMAMAASGYFGVFLLHSLGLTSSSIILDILVTGLAIGGGTKPLHDLITNIQKAKEEKQDPPQLAK